MIENTIPLESYIPGENQSNGRESAPVDPSAGQLSPDGSFWLDPKAIPNQPYIDVKRGVFITSRGDEIQLSDKPVSALIVERIQNEGKPKIPLIEVSILGRKQSEYFAGHEGYQARLTEWQYEAQMAVMRYLFVVGVKGNPPKEFVNEQRQFFLYATDQEMKYLWIASILPDGDMEYFTEAVMGRALPSAKGVEQAANFTE